MVINMNNKNKHINGENVPSDILKWTKQASECYKRRCRCEGCFIHNTIESECKMKIIVPKIFAKWGEPPKEIKSIVPQVRKYERNKEN